MTRFGGDGRRIYSRQFEYQPRALPEVVVESVVDSMAARLTSINPYLTADRARSEIRNALFVPEFQPPVSKVLVSPDGRVLLLRESVSVDTARWEILAPDGSLEATMTAPASLNLMVTDSRSVWGTETDDLGVTYVVRQRINRAAERP